MDDFDKTFGRFMGVALFTTIATVLASLAVLGFVGWVVVMLLKYFGVI